MGFTLKDLKGDFETAYVTIDKGNDSNRPYLLSYVTDKGKDSTIVLPEVSNDWLEEMEIYHKNVKEIPNILKSLASEDNLLGVYQWNMAGITSYNLVARVARDADHPFQAFSFTPSEIKKPADSYRHDAIEPDHYKNGNHDLLWHLMDILTPEEFRGAMKMNIIKYVVRENNKNGIEDIDKAKEYINRFEEFEKWLNNENN